MYLVVRRVFRRTSGPVANGYFFCIEFSKVSFAVVAVGSEIKYNIIQIINNTTTLLYYIVTIIVRDGGEGEGRRAAVKIRSARARRSRVYVVGRGALVGNLPNVFPLAYKIMDESSTCYDI